MVEAAEEAIRRAGVEPRRTLIRGGTDGASSPRAAYRRRTSSRAGRSTTRVREWLSVQDMAAAAATIVELVRFWGGEYGMTEARLEPTPAGLMPAEDGWVVTWPMRGDERHVWRSCLLDGPVGDVHPDRLPAARAHARAADRHVHRENNQEDFLVRPASLAAWKARSGAYAHGTSCTAPAGRSSCRTGSGPRPLHGRVARGMAGSGGAPRSARSRCARAGVQVETNDAASTRAPRSGGRGCRRVSPGFPGRTA